MSRDIHKGVIAFGPSRGGGTATFYRNLSTGLRALGWEVYSVAMGLRPDEIYRDDSTIALASSTVALSEQVKEFLDWVNRAAVNIVVSFNPNLLPAIPHLPNTVKYLTITHGIRNFDFIWNTLFLERISYIICVCQRQEHEFLHRFHISPGKIKLIPNGININHFNSPKEFGHYQKLELAFLGRVDDIDKGISWLPKIFKKIVAAGVDFRMHIFGKGNDLAWLESAVSRAQLTKQVQFHGWVSYEELPGLLSLVDIMLLPSRNEGFPMVLLEGMAAGCVPIASLIRGSTDMIIRNGQEGFLCRMGDTSQFAECVVKLANDRQKLITMSKAARERVKKQFTMERVVADYDKLFTQVLAEGPSSITPRPLSEVSYPRELLPGWTVKLKKFLPAVVKKTGRKFERFGRTMLYRWFDRIT